MNSKPTLMWLCGSFFVKLFHQLLELVRLFNLIRGQEECLSELHVTLAVCSHSNASMKSPLDCWHELQNKRFPPKAVDCIECVRMPHGTLWCKGSQQKHCINLVGHLPHCWMTSASRFNARIASCSSVVGANVSSVKSPRSFSSLNSLSF